MDEKALLRVIHGLVDLELKVKKLEKRIQQLESEIGQMGGRGNKKERNATSQNGKQGHSAEMRGL
jgi:proteasome assembly chaperone (PAC2) family protein